MQKKNYFVLLAFTLALGNPLLSVAKKKAKVDLTALKTDSVNADVKKIKKDATVGKGLFTTYFNALAQMDESALSSTLAPVLTSFLHRANATKADVSQYMKRLHEADVTKIEFAPNGDWAIEKVKLADGLYAYNVNFTVAQHTERGEEGPKSSSVFKVTASVSPEGRITELNMKRSVQE